MEPVVLRPEDADSWGEFNARFEQEMASRRPRVPPRLLAIGGFFYTMSVLSLGYGHWWLAPCLLVTVAVVVLLARAVTRADQLRARESELARLRDTWLNRLQQDTTTW